MTEYIPKVGDKVRATLGENVLVGEVTGSFTDAEQEIVVAHFSKESHFVFVVSDGWHFEPFVELPTLPGAVIECEDVLWSYAGDDDRLTWRALSNGRPWATDTYFTGKQFIVHFAGVQK